MFEEEVLRIHAYYGLPQLYNNILRIREKKGCDQLSCAFDPHISISEYYLFYITIVDDNIT